MNITIVKLHSVGSTHWRRWRRRQSLHIHISANFRWRRRIEMEWKSEKKPTWQKQWDRRSMLWTHRDSLKFLMLILHWKCNTNWHDVRNDWSDVGNRTHFRGQLGCLLVDSLGENTKSVRPVDFDLCCVVFFKHARIKWKMKRTKIEWKREGGRVNWQSNAAMSCLIWFWFTIYVWVGWWLFWCGLFLCYSFSNSAHLCAKISNRRNRRIVDTRRPAPSTIYIFNRFR